MWISFIYGKDYVVILKDQRYLNHKEKLKKEKEKRNAKVDEGIDRYFRDLDDRDFTADYKLFVHWLLKEKYTNLTIRNKCSSIKYFFHHQKDSRCKIDDDDWGQIKRTLIPKSTKAQTKDKILTKKQLKLVLPYLSIHGRAMALFLISTGARIGMACQLLMTDIFLDKEPAEVDIRDEITKFGVGGRLMWMSEEARDAILEWHFTRKNIQKSGVGGSYDKNKVFNFIPAVFREQWNNALKKADRGADPPVLAQRENSTRKRFHIYHVHTLRKFFSTKMKLAGVPSDTVHALMGHQAYLAAAYDRFDSDLPELYKKHMDVVTVHEVAGPITIDEVLLDGMAEEIGAYEGLSEEDKEGLSMKEKYLLVKAKLVKIKEEKKVPVAEMEVDAEEHDEFMDLFKEATVSSRAPAK